MKLNLLKGEIVANGFTVQDVADKLGITRNTMYSRLNGKTFFNAKEIIQLCEILNISDASRRSEIFLSKPFQ
jgi:transcriptional regulator with XRE-family HTH domain